MKRLPRCLLAFSMLIALYCNAVEIYVATNGSDFYPGTKDKPLASISAALRKSRELRRLNDPSISNGIHIIIREGVYHPDEPVFIRPEDSGTPSSPTIIKSFPGEKVVISGGIQLKNWSRQAKRIIGLPTVAQGNVWTADIPLYGGRPAEFRQLWVNDSKAIRARDRNGDSMYRILSWNKTEQTCWIPKPQTASLQNAEGMEMFIHQWWAVATLRIRKMMVQGDSVKLFFHQPESRVQSEHPWPAPWISAETGNSAFCLTNAIQLLDEPGEWWLDIAARKLYYWPRSGEDLRNAVATVPFLETLVRIEGTVDSPVENIFFQDISFQHTGWLRPSQQGHVPHQAGMYMLDAYKLKIPGTPEKKTLENQAWVGRPAAAIQITFARNTGFESCDFQHMASTALDYGRGSAYNFIRGNIFSDIGGTAILAGVFSEEPTEVHLPYNPRDEREVCSNIQISNNLISNAANEDWGCVGIGAGYVRNVEISHNDISDVSYTGISLGWGWTPTANVMKNNRITGNKIHHYAKHMYDVAGIYTLSAQPGSEISGNCIDSIYKAPYAHIPSHWFYLYTDEGSSYFTIKDNWCPSAKFLQNANGPGNVWTNNGPTVADSIKQAAGLQPGFRHLVRPAYTRNSWPVNRERPMIAELVTPIGDTLSTARLKQILVQHSIDPASLYQWQNHYVIFDSIPDVYLLKERLGKAFPGVQLKVYDDIFYEFNREKCDKGTAKAEWQHILLTANLVDDKKLQKEYMDHHATQFEKWPEVSKGFCNAQFQQLLLYRKGQQLMLVISIPRGESLEKLNPKTSEDNPRVDEWNNLMKKYQQGIPGTRKGETWVFLKTVQN